MTRPTPEDILAARKLLISAFHQRIVPAGYHHDHDEEFAVLTERPTAESLLFTEIGLERCTTRNLLRTAQTKRRQKSVDESVQDAPEL